jgi:uncharacterized lipoprotein YddW (UPF0748 family)
LGVAGFAFDGRRMRTNRLTISSILFSICCFLLTGFAHAEEVRGLWVECEGSNATLSSPDKIQDLISLSKYSGVNTIFLQVYRHNRSWYNSGSADTTPFDIVKAKYSIDPLSYTINLAHKNGIKVHAWINVLRIGKDSNAPVLKELGRDVVTRDGSGKSILQYPSTKLPDGGFWLDPGDPSVLKYTLKITGEILKKYPSLDGIHLDYIRYPYGELTPGAQFSNKGDLGYGKLSVERFKNLYGYSPLTMDLNNRNTTQRWDDWRREQVTNLVSGVYAFCKKQNPEIQVSCAVQPWQDRAYLVAYQDWRNWLANNIVDFVVLMNYSIDTKIVEYLSDSAIKTSPGKSVYIGLGAYMLTKSPYKLYQQIKNCQKLGAKGIVLFSYDAVLKNKNIFKDISKNKWWKY